jgi:hypothetical protein
VPILINGGIPPMQTIRWQSRARIVQGNSAQQKGGRVCDRLIRHSGAHEVRTLVRGCAPENLEIPGSMLRIAPG